VSKDLANHYIFRWAPVVSNNIPPCQQHVAISRFDMSCVHADDIFI